MTHIGNVLFHEWYDDGELCRTISIEGDAHDTTGMPADTNPQQLLYKIATEYMAAPAPRCPRPKGAHL